MAQESSPSLTALLARVFWMLIGPLLLFVLAFNIGDKGTGWFTPSDIAFFMVLGGMLLARWWEYRGGTANTTMGEPATPQDLRRYVVMTLVIGTAVWVVANLIGNYWLAS